jgi:hypothetical protein
MPLVKIRDPQDEYGLWINSSLVLEVGENRDNNYVKMAGSGTSGPYTIKVKSATAVARAIMAAENKSDSDL